jgi:ATP-dependent helicase IRC3
VGEGVQRPLVALPTGTGKTVVFSHLIDQRPGRSLVLAHRDELLCQCQEKLLLVNPHMDAGIVKAGENETGADVVVASVQTLSRSNRLQQVFSNFNTVIVDEAHHGVADTYQRTLEYMGCFAEGGPLTVGFTATPERGDKAGLGQVWEKIVYQREILDMILGGYLCDLRAVRVSLRVNLDRVKTHHGDFDDKSLETVLLDANAPRYVAVAYLEYARGRKALVFTPSVRLAHEMAGTFLEVGIKAEALGGNTPAEERRAMLRRLRSGETMVLANCAVLTEGFDEPSVDCIIVARPTKSRPFYLQMIGRGTRVYPGKDDLLVLDVVGASTRHSLMTATALFQTRLDDKSVLEAEEERQEREAARAVPLVDGDLVATEANLFRVRPMHWVQTRRGRWVLSLGGQAQLRLVPSRTENGKWVVIHAVGREKRRVYSGLPLDYALGAGEDFAREHGAWALFASSARWRSSKVPPSPEQVGFMRKVGLSVQPGLTKAQASDLLLSVTGDWD